MIDHELPTLLPGPDLGDIDGVNQWDAIIGAAKSNRAEFLVNIDPIFKNSALRWGPWKLYHGQCCDHRYTTSNPD